ncbi:MAG: hypothetical protein IKM97_01195 [Clostridia bacterium]|nr:hypothetical protein [Clostridia bacterium]
MELDKEFIDARDDASRAVWNMLINNGIPNDKIHLYHQHIMSGVVTTGGYRELIIECSNSQERINEMITRASQAILSNRQRKPREELRDR